MLPPYLTYVHTNGHVKTLTQEVIFDTWWAAGSCCQRGGIYPTCRASSLPVNSNLFINCNQQTAKYATEEIKDRKQEFASCFSSWAIFKKILACAWMRRVRGICATVCEERRWCSSRNHLSTLGCTAGGGTVCIVCVLSCPTQPTRTSLQGHLCKPCLWPVSLTLTSALLPVCVYMCVHRSSKRK